MTLSGQREGADREFLAYLKSRRTVPTINLDDPGPSRQEIDEILTIAARVPDHGKLAPWRFILFDREAGKLIGAKLAARADDLNGPLDDEQRNKEMIRFTRAPVVIGVVSTASEHPKIPLWEQELSAGAVCLNLMHAAHAMGFSAQWLTEWYAFDEDIARTLGAKDGERFAGFVHIGTPKVDPVERARPDVGALTNHWSDI